MKIVMGLAFFVFHIVIVGGGALLLEALTGSAFLGNFALLGVIYSLSLHAFIDAEQLKY